MKERLFRYPRLSRNFMRNEIACKGEACCGGVAVAHPLQVTLAQALRDRVDTALHVTSGFRCVIHNKMVGGVPGSDHCFGCAWDLVSLVMPPPVMYAAAQEIIAELGYGYVLLYDDFIHLGVRPNV